MPHLNSYQNGNQIDMKNLKTRSYFEKNICVAGIFGNQAFPEMPGFSSIA
jgi:hypothetical protein